MIKLNKKLCPPEKLQHTNEQFGDLNYFVYMLQWNLRIVRRFTDKFHGEMVELKVLNDTKVQSAVIFKLNDITLGENYV